MDGEKFAVWFIENIDYTGCKVFNTLANQEIQEYALTINTAKEISMLQRTDKGKEARMYFIECEKQLNNQLPSIYLDALKALVVSEEAKQLAEHKVIELTPKAIVFDNISNSNTLLSFNDVAKSICIGRNNMMKILRDKKILRSNNTPYQSFIDSHMFEVKIKPINGLNITQTFVTGKGLIWLSDLMSK